MPRNPSKRFIKNVHLTGKGHSFRSPWPLDDLDFLLVCRECGSKSGTDHFHAGVEFKQKRTFESILKASMQQNPEAGQIDLRPHKNFGSIIGYHLGLGDKPRCDPKGIEWVKTYPGFDPEDFIKCALSHKAHKNHREINAVLLKTPISDLADQGIVHATNLPRINTAQQLYLADKSAQSLAGRE